MTIEQLVNQDGTMTRYGEQMRETFGPMHCAMMITVSGFSAETIVRLECMCGGRISRRTFAQIRKRFPRPAPNPYLTVEEFRAMYQQQPLDFAGKIEDIGSTVERFRREYAGSFDPLEIHEGMWCPECHGERLRLEPPKSCSCHLGRAPCSGCMERGLECRECGFKHQPEEAV